jgi:peptidoglycan hydrolase-like protein with peptidoglycan-binding domain
LVLFAIAPLFAFAQVNTMSTASCPNISHTFSRGMSGIDVRALQTYLVAQGFLSNNATTGYFGNLTQIAVQHWQAAHNIASSDTPATPQAPSTLEAPVTKINGANPSHGMVGTTYADLDATTIGPQADLNLGIQASADAVSSKPIAVLQLDTSKSCKRTITYQSPRPGGRNAAQIEHRQKRIRALRPPRPKRQDGRREVDRLAHAGGAAIPPIGKYRS